MTPCLFVSDVHGRPDRWRKLFAAISGEIPAAVFLGGDLFPSGSWLGRADEELPDDFIDGFLAPAFRDLRSALGGRYPAVFAIPGNDDPRVEWERMAAGEAEGLWTLLHERRARLSGRPVLGYACVPPTPFPLKDWERYDVGRHVSPGCVSPEEGLHTVPVEPRILRYATIERDLDLLAGEMDLAEAVLLLHTPPFETNLDRAATDGRMVDSVPMDRHVGSVAVRRFIEARRPRVTLHGHVHESARLTGSWRDVIGSTHAFSAAHDGPELALVRFDPGDPARASRELL